MSTTLTPTPSRARSVAAWSLQGLLSAAFLYFGISKLVGDESSRASYEEIGAGQWLRYFTGTTETLGGIALLVLPLAGLAAAALAAQMVGAIFTQVVIVENGSAVLPTILLLLTAAAAWLRRDRSVDTLRMLRGRLLPVAR